MALLGEFIEWMNSFTLMDRSNNTAISEETNHLAAITVAHPKIGILLAGFAFDVTGSQRSRECFDHRLAMPVAHPRILWPINIRKIMHERLEVSMFVERSLDRLALLCKPVETVLARISVQAM